MKFCYECGHSLKKMTPPGDNRLRGVCSNESCSYIHYVNPKNIVGTIPVWRDKVLLCKRAIQPRYGYWTVPAGFMECGETTEQGAVRETWEEAQAKVTLKQLYRVYDLPYISQVYFFYLAMLDDEQHGPGEESLETELFTAEQIPWDDMAFTVVGEALKDFFIERKQSKFTIQHKTIQHPSKLK